MSVRSLNWIKFGGLVGFAFILGLVFAGLLDLPSSSLAQNPTKRPETTQVIPASTAKPPQALTASSPATSPLVMLSDAFAAVAEQVRPSVVYIRSRRTERVTADRRQGQFRLPQGLEEFFGSPNQRGRNNNQQPEVEQGAGSGFVVSSEGYILTNNHVVDGADEVVVRLLDRHEFKAKVIGTDPNTDVAVIKIDTKGEVPLRAAALGSSTAARVGEWVLAVGNPLSENLNFTVTSGIISAKGRGRLPLPGAGNYAIQDFLQTDAAINRGNSGGPLLNVRGEVIGINSAIFSPTGVSAGYAFAIPIDLARQVMEQLISKGKVERAALGVSVDDANAVDAEDVGLSEIYGVRVNSFTDDSKSPAKAAGIEPGDVIVSIDGQRVEYTAQLQQLVGFKKPGETVKVEVARKRGVRKIYTVRLVPQIPIAQVAAREPGEAQPETAESGVDIKERLGVTVEPVDAQAVQELELSPTARGVIVQTVDPYGPTEGLLNPPSQQSVDIISSYDGKPIRTETDLRTAMKASRPGEIVSLGVTVALGGGQSQNKIVRVKVR